MSQITKPSGQQVLLVVVSFAFLMFGSAVGRECAFSRTLYKTGRVIDAAIRDPGRAEG